MSVGLEEEDDEFLGRSHWLLSRELIVREQERGGNEEWQGGPGSGHLLGWRLWRWEEWTDDFIHPICGTKGHRSDEI